MSCKATLVAFLPACVLSCCVTPERALRNLGCDESISHLVNNVLMNTWGIGSFACVRLRTTTQVEQRSVEAACTIAQAPRAFTEYPARGNPMVPPPWWDLREGEQVEYATLHGPGGHWEGFVYVRRVASAASWFMCAGGL